MRFVYPPNGHQAAEASTFFVGAVTPGTTVTCQGEPVSISAEGFFSHLVSLSYGENQVQWQDSLGNSQSVSIRRIEPLAFGSLPVLFPWPHVETWVESKEPLRFACVAPQGAKVWAHLGEMAPVALWDCGPIQAPKVGIFGQLHAVEADYPPQAHRFATEVPVSLNLARDIDLTVIYTLEIEGETHTLGAPGSLRVLTTPGLWGQVSQDQAVCRIFPSNGERLAPLLSGVRLPITGRQGDWLQVALSERERVWIHNADIRLGGGPPSLQPLPLVQISKTPQGAQVRVPRDHPVPFQWRFSETGLSIRLFQTPCGCDFVGIAPGLEGVTAQVTPVDATTTELEVSLGPHILGVLVQQEGGWLCFDIKTIAAFYHRPVKVALDPGHGGTEPGTHTPDGTAEKDLNLAMALQLQKILQNIPSVEVYCLRLEDETLSLAERIRRAQDWGADMVLSLHHNALPDGREPLKERGVCTFYHNPGAMPLAQALQSALVSGTAFKDSGVHRNNLAVCREMGYWGVLLELGFATHPEDAALILDTAHQHRVAQALATGLVDFIESLTP